MPVKNSLIEGNLRLKILPEDIRKRFKGSLRYQAPDVDEKWIYYKTLVDGQDGVTAQIFIDDISYITTTTDTDIDVDYCKFLVVKHTGFTNLQETATTKTLGVMLNFMGDMGNATVAHDGTATEQFIWMEPGDTVAIKIPRVRLDKISARVATLGLSGPASNGDVTTVVLLETVAIVRDGGIGI